MDTSSPTIPAETARHVLAHFGADGGIPAGSFTQQLITTIAMADMVNKAKLAGAFPDYTAAVIGAEYDPDGIAFLQRLAASDVDGPAQCSVCKSTVGPFVPGHPVRCEDCAGGGQ